MRFELPISLLVLVAIFLVFVAGFNTGQLKARNECKALLREYKNLLNDTVSTLEKTIPVLEDCARR